MQKARGHPYRAPTACKQTVSGTISLPSPGFFSPFPHGTGSLSVTSEYLALPDGPGRFMQDFSCPALLGCQTKKSLFLTYAAITLSGQSFQTVLLNLTLIYVWSHNPKRTCSFGLGLSAFARRYWRNHWFVFFSSRYWDGSLPSVRSFFKVIGFPHSDICGSKIECISPQLFAAYHVLHRLEVPRHSPSALSSLTIKFAC